MTAEGLIIVRVNIRFPQYQKGLLKLRSDKQSETYTQLIEKELTHVALFEVLNSYFPPAVEGDEDYDAGDCVALVDSIKYRYRNNDFLNICYRVSEHMKKNYKK